MVNAHQRQQRCTKVVDMHAVFDSGHADFICSTVAETFLHTRVGQEDGIARDVMVAAVGTLRGWQATELVSSNNARCARSFRSAEVGWSTRRLFSMSLLCSPSRADGFRQSARQLH